MTTLKERLAAIDEGSMYDAPATTKAAIDEALARIEALEAALRPFALAEFDTPVAEGDGWSETGLSWCRERIRDWFGPSDFLRARLTLEGEER